MKIVVTGCSGYVGTALVERLLQDDSFRVVGVDRIRTERPLGGRFSFVECDLSAPAGLLAGAAFDDVQAVIHLAAARGDWAISASEYWRDNLAATEGLLGAPWAASVPHWLFMSSVSTYGPSNEALTEDAACRPVGPYGESKLASERAFLEFIRRNRLRGCAIRPSAIFSAGHPNNTNVYRLIESLMRFPIPLIGGGNNRKTLTYLPNLLDLVFWCLDLMHRGEMRSEVYNYVEEPVPTVATLIQALRHAGIRPARTVKIPLGLALAMAYPVYLLGRLTGVDLRVTPERVNKYAASTCYDASKVKRDGFVPAVDLEAALATTARWHLMRHAERGAAFNASADEAGRP